MKTLLKPVQGATLGSADVLINVSQRNVKNNSRSLKINKKMFPMEFELEHLVLAVWDSKIQKHEYVMHRNELRLSKIAQRGRIYNPTECRSSKSTMYCVCFVTPNSNMCTIWLEGFILFFPDYPNDMTWLINLTYRFKTWLDFVAFHE